jgi:hypothetical protein
MSRARELAGLLKGGTDTVEQDNLENAYLPGNPTVDNPALSDISTRIASTSHVKAVVTNDAILYAIALG